MARGRGQRHSAKPTDLRERTNPQPVEVRVLSDAERAERIARAAAKRRA